MSIISWRITAVTGGHIERDIIFYLYVHGAEERCDGGGTGCWFGQTLPHCRARLPVVDVALPTPTLQHPNSIAAPHAADVVLLLRLELLPERQTVLFTIPYAWSFG